MERLLVSQPKITHMTIEFAQVMPHPLREIAHGEKSIWGNSFRLESGQKVLLNAASGKGKSTFTFSIFGLRNDYDGKILFDGKEISSLSLDEWTTIRQNKLAVVFQDLQLFPNFTVRENLLLKSELQPVFTEEEIRQFVIRLGLESKWNQACGILSMGQQQRIAIIRALVQPFEWLILDEPFSHLDDENTQIALQLINEITDKNKAGFVLTSLGEHYNFKYNNELYL